MSAKVLTKAAAKEAKIDIIEDGRGTQAVHDVVVAMRAARRSGSANTKTKAFVDLVRKQTDAEKVLIVSDSFDDRTYKSARNVKPVKLATAADVNTQQLLTFQKILVTSKALEKLAERLSPPMQEEPRAE